MKVEECSVLKSDLSKAISSSNSKKHMAVASEQDKSKILLSPPHMSGYEEQYVKEAFDTNWIAPVGPNIDAFEKEMAQYVGCNAAVALSSGTAGLHLALRLLNVGAGDHVFCSSLTFVASANPILYQNAIPVFIDSEASSWNMSPQALKRAFEHFSAQKKLPKAVIVVHLYGQSADMDAIQELCDHYGVPIIEDAAESLGASYKGRASGSIGKIGVYSFNGNKIITSSGGGMMVSNDAELMKKGKFLATQAKENAPYYYHKEVGYNYRLSNVSAGIGRGQLRVLDERVSARRKIFDRYRQSLSDIECIKWMHECSYGRSSRWLSTMLIDSSLTDVTATLLITELGKIDIEARHIWKPLHSQPLFTDYMYFPHVDSHSCSDEIYQNGICLPSGSNLSLQQQKRVIDSIRKVFCTEF